MKHPRLPGQPHQTVPVLRVVKQWPGASGMDIANRLHESRSTIMRALQELQRSGLIVCAAVTDPNHDRCGKLGWFRVQETAHVR